MQDCGQNWYCNHCQNRVCPRLPHDSRLPDMLQVPAGMYVYM